MQFYNCTLTKRKKRAAKYYFTDIYWPPFSRKKNNKREGNQKKLQGIHIKMEIRKLICTKEIEI